MPEPAPAIPARPAAPVAAPAEGPLKILGVHPPDGAEIDPRTRFVVRFDRPLHPASASNAFINCEYADPRATFVADPFRLTAVWPGQAGVLTVKPPDLLPGRDVLLRISTRVRGGDGSMPEQDPAQAPGTARVLRYRVMELPP